MAYFRFRELFAWAHLGSFGLLHQTCLPLWKKSVAGTCRKRELDEHLTHQRDAPRGTILTTEAVSFPRHMGERPMVADMHKENSGMSVVSPKIKGVE